MRKKTMIIVGLILCFCFLLSACKQTIRYESFKNASGTEMVSRVQGEQIAVYQDGKWQELFWNGINIGATTPGHYPGELSPSYDDYCRWMDYCEDLGISVIRVYTILPPEFYQALVEHNKTAESKLWFVQGIWSPEEALIKSKNAYLPSITNEFEEEIRLAVLAVYGLGTIPANPGKAFGSYSVNTAPYLLAWMIGSEWDPGMVDGTNKMNPEKSQFSGQYFKTSPQANPFEAWLASMLEKLAEEEVKTGWQHPFSFVNWVTTDPLEHPDEPFEQEDLASVDPLHVKATSLWDAGYYAAFHVYPYYPDSLRYQADYQNFVAPDGSKDPYLAYLLTLRQHLKGIPLVIAEFGLPSSRGMAHLGPLGRNQGMHTEKEQGEKEVALFERIREAGCAGAFVFELSDEWFKFTWNTIDLEIPADRRAMWLNRLTNEEQFGLIANDPGNWTAVLLDGTDTDWQQLASKKEQTSPSMKIAVHKDEGYLYLLLDKNDQWDWSHDQLIIGFDQQSGGNLNSQVLPVVFSQGIEFLMKIDNEQSAHIQVASSYDAYRYLWGFKKKITRWEDVWSSENNGIFLPWTLCLSRPLFLPATERLIPIEEIDVGVMNHGISDPYSPEYNSLSDYYIQDHLIEVRIPWMLLGYTDPSTNQVWTYPHRKNLDQYTATTSSGINIEVGVVNKLTGQVAMEKPLHYKWENWDTVQSHERKKQSYYILKEYFHQRNNGQ